MMKKKIRIRIGYGGVCECVCSWYWKCWQWQCGFSVLVFLTHSYYQIICYACHVCVVIIFIYIWMFGLVWFRLSDWLLSLDVYVNVNVSERHILHTWTSALTQQNHFISSILMCVYIKIVHCLYFSCYFNIEKVFLLQIFVFLFLAVQICVFILSIVEKLFAK